MNRPSFDEYFIGIAQAVSKRSTCLRRQYGSVIVKDNIQRSSGYNGAPRGEENCCERGTCTREELHVSPGERYELCCAVHSEANSCLAASAEEMKGSTIYIAGFNTKDGSIASGKPCKMCMRLIKNAQIAKIVYLDIDNEIKTIEVGEAK